MSGTYGVEQTKKVLLAVAELGNVLEKVLKGQGIVAIFSLADEFALLAGLDGALLVKEVEELDEEDKLELLRSFQAKFDLADDKVEAFVESLLSIAVDASEVIGKTLKLFMKA